MKIRSTKTVIIVGNHILPEKSSTSGNDYFLRALSDNFFRLVIIGRRNSKKYEKFPEENFQRILMKDVGGNAFLNSLIFIMFAYYHLLRLTSFKSVNLFILNASEMISFIPVFLVSLVKRTSFIYHLQGEILDSQAYNPLFRAIVILELKFSSKIRVVSKNIYQSIFRINRKLSKKATVITTRVDTKLFFPKTFNNNERFSSWLKNQIYEKPTPINLVTLGSLIPIKGLPRLLVCLKNLKSKCQFHLNIIGDGPLREELEQMSQEMNLSNHITFHGQIQHLKVPSLLRQCEIFIMPSISEGFPRALLEALSCGLYPIASSVGGITQIIQNGINGILVPKAYKEKELSTDPLEHAIETVINNFYHDFHKNVFKAININIKIINEYYTIEKNVDQFNVFFLGLSKEEYTNKSLI